ncbi:hypothetical protein MiTs_03174 [Microcystis aeruginosa NIES-2521]|uniref:Uncharacterized protein n=1 Tax=Microcystis aeruginosa NIES-2521 TaxID=2303983 RepID=A0A5A5S6W1_MICAE|nr:hypothetical protein MiTs_03174 [Microcystis aeruginosa NIES-2521]
MMSFLAVHEFTTMKLCMVEVVTILFQVMLVLTTFMERMGMMSSMGVLIMIIFMVVMGMTPYKEQMAVQENLII